MGFDLPEGAIELLRAMDGDKPASINRHILWVDQCKYKIQDLFALRAARLVAIRPGDQGQRMEIYNLTDAGAAYLDALNQADDHLRGDSGHPNP